MKKLNQISLPLNFSTFHIFLILFLSLITFFSSSCSKDDPEPDLVPITMTGENTMGFYLDGVPHNKIGVSTWDHVDGVNVGLTVEGKLLIFGGGGNPRIEIKLEANINKADPLNRIYILSDFTVGNGQGFLLDNSPLGGDLFLTNSNVNGVIELSKLDNNAISGKFKFDAINEESGKIIHITDGRFDIKR